MFIHLENDSILADISDCGAELQRIYDKRNCREVLWSGSPEIWASRAPWLFPIIGQLKGHSLRIHGRQYTIPMHGFASKRTFGCRQISDTEAAFELCADHDTLAVYPWQFLLSIRYRLECASLTIGIQISCKDDRPMDFSFGAHPGFLCSEGDLLSFPSDKSLNVQRLDPSTHLLMPGITKASSEITLREELFDDDAMLVRQPCSTCVTLLRRDQSGVRFDFGQVPWVGLWSMKRKGLPYICIEPWFGVDDPVDASGDIEQKPDIVHLPAGETFRMSMKITPF